MANINLLPWREEMRRQKTNEYYTLMGLIVGLAAALIFSVQFHINQKIKFQKNSRNQYLVSQIDILKVKLKEIEELEDTKENLIARMNVIQDLQGSRPLIVHLFDEIVYTIPEGLWLTSIEQKDTTLTIQGKAESNARVSAYMRNVDNSKWMKKPLLQVIEASKDQRNAIFKMSLKQDSPQGLEDEEEE